MFRITISLSFLALVFGVPVQERTPRIVGGYQADIKNYPYTVSLMRDHEHICGGAIIQTKYVLTTARCVTGIETDELKIRAGSSNHNSGGVTSNIKHIYQHPQYDHNSFDYDLAILELEHALQLSQSINFVDLPDPALQTPEGTLVTVTGWGSIGNGIMPALLQYIEGPIIGQDKCKNYYGTKLTDRMLCAGNIAGGKDICDGDNGGPLVTSNHVLVGLASWHSCAEANKPGVYVKISTVRDFISTVTGF